ncbi:MAG: 5-oxoprolinase subunit PxpB [Thermoanaerobaculia bacterium]
MTKTYEIHRVAERALLVRFLDDDLARAVAQSSALHAFLSRPNDSDSQPESKSASQSETGLDATNARPDRAKMPPAEPTNPSDLQPRLRRAEWIPGAGNLLLRVEETTAAEAEARLESLLSAFPFRRSAATGRPIEIAVRFGGENGEDLQQVAAETGLSESAVVSRLCSAPLSVAFIGFSPGFPYLVGLPPELELPRLASPRPAVPPGSVAIGGPFVGIYPAATPGGWRLLGRTDVALFDPASSPPAVLAAGDRIRFIAR